MLILSLMFQNFFSESGKEAFWFGNPFVMVDLRA